MGYAADELGHEVVDCGAFEYDEGDDYPGFIQSAVAYLLESEDGARAIVLGGSGQGEAMVANRFPGVRAAVFYGGPEEILTLSREHNDANVLSLGARFLNEDEAKGAVRVWLEAQFSSEDRHVRRIKDIDGQ